MSLSAAVILALTAFILLLSEVPVGAQEPSPQPQPPPTAVQTSDPITGPIRPDDTIRVLVAGVEGQGLGGEVRVENNGSISLPRLGAFQAATLMPADLASAVKKRIEEKKLLKKADVAVYILSRRAREVQVNGAVTVNGRQVIKDNATLSEAIEAAVPQGTADLSRVVLSRNGKDSEINYLRFRNGSSNDPEFNPRLEDGDRIFIYSAAPTEGFVRITGEVKESTKVIVPLAQGSTVGQLLQVVGGITDFADRNGIVIERKGFRIFVPYDDIMKKMPGKDIPLQDKDIVVVPRLERPRQFTVAGAVRDGKSFPLTTKTTLLQAVAQAGGTIDGAKQNSVEVRRTAFDGKVVTRKYDLLNDADAGTEIADGDYVFVPFPRRRQNLDLPALVGIISSAVFIYSQIR